MAYFSYSQLALYRTCPKKFWFMRTAKTVQDTDGRRAFVGDVLGLMMEWFYAQRIWQHGPSASMVLGSLAAAAGDEVERTRPKLTYPWTVGEREGWIRVAEETAPLMVATIKRERLLAPRVETERDLQVLLPSGDILVGRADLLIHRSPEEIVLLDGKGGGSLGKHVKSDQLRFYALGCLSAYKRIPRQMGFWWFRHDKVVWKGVRVSMLPRFVAGIEATIASLRAQHFTPTPKEPVCKYCPALRVCPEGTAVMETMDTSVALPNGMSAGTLSL